MALLRCSAFLKHITNNSDHLAKKREVQGANNSFFSEINAQSAFILCFQSMVHFQSTDLNLRNQPMRIKPWPAAPQEWQLSLPVCTLQIVLRRQVYWSVAVGRQQSGLHAGGAAEDLDAVERKNPKEGRIVLHFLPTSLFFKNVLVALRETESAHNSYVVICIHHVSEALTSSLLPHVCPLPQDILICMCRFGY